MSSISSLLNSPLGREILADVLDAASAVLRRSRESGRAVAAVVNSAVDTGMDAAASVADAGAGAASTAMEVGSDVASGAMEAGERISAAAVDMAQAAAGAMAAMATGSVLNMMSGGDADAGSKTDKGRGGSQKRRSAGGEGTSS